MFFVARTDRPSSDTPTDATPITDSHGRTVWVKDSDVEIHPDEAERATALAIGLAFVIVLALLAWWLWP